MLGYFKGSLVFTVACLMAAGWLGYAEHGTALGALDSLWIVAVLGVLETSLSFDNAVVNATVLRGMAPVWRRRFVTWGIVIAVVGTRIVFPIAIVAAAARLGPVAAVRLALGDPAGYKRIMIGAHTGFAGFGGAFLGMVGLVFFLDAEKDVHWLGPIERPLARLSGGAGAALAIVLLALLGMAALLPAAATATFLAAGLLGLLGYVAIHALGAAMGGDAIGGAASGAARSGLAAFLYLELLDASFSIDGVVGAFALSNNLLVIALGLGIGAMFVRSLTLLMVDRGTLGDYRFLEHGAFYAIVALAAIMLLSVRFAIPDALTGLIGAGVIALAFLSSARRNRAEAA